MKLSRWLMVGAGCLAVWACNGQSAPRPRGATSAPPSTATSAAATSSSELAAQPNGDCVPALDEGSKTARIFGTGSHALAKTDVTIDLGSGKMTGKTFELDGKDVKTIAVDDTLQPEELTKLRKALEATCVVPQAPAGEAQGVPGGYSYLEIVGGGGTLWVMVGTPHETLPAGARYASVPIDDWKRIGAAYPKLRPSERAAPPGK